jgi:ATP-dependent protease Clp ATPase subunit
MEFVSVIQNTPSVYNFTEIAKEFEGWDAIVCSIDKEGLRVYGAAIKGFEDNLLKYLRDTYPAVHMDVIYCLQNKNDCHLKLSVDEKACEVLGQTKVEALEEKSTGKIENMSETESSTATASQKAADFIRKTSFRAFYDAVRLNIIGQDNELAMACSNVYRYMQALAKGEVYKRNFIITAPSGTGKTQFYRELKRILSPYIAVIIIDSSTITPSGFKGRNVSDVFKELFCSQSEEGEALIFLDEIDKIIAPSYSSEGTNINGAVQASLLTFIEGTSSTLSKIDNGKKIEKKLDTGRSLIVGLGAFQNIRNRKKQLANPKKTLGFAIERDETERDIPDGQGLYSILEYQDIIQYGASEELMGRFNQIINFRKIDDDAYLRIIYNYVANMADLPENCRVRITNEGAKDFLRFAGSEMGIREIHRRLDNTIQQEVIKLMLNDDADSFTSITINGYMNTFTVEYDTEEAVDF